MSGNDAGRGAIQANEQRIAEDIAINTQPDGGWGGQRGSVEHSTAAAASDSKAIDINAGRQPAVVAIKLASGTPLCLPLTRRQNDRRGQPQPVRRHQLRGDNAN